MSSSLEQELKLPSEATLSISNPYKLKTVGGSASISISPATSLRPGAHCLIVGRLANGADIRIQHGSISRKHAAFYYNQHENLCLQDFGGKHGTFVNGKRIQGEIVLQGGDSIVFGNVRENVFTVVGPVPSAADTQPNNQQNTNAELEKDVTPQEAAEEKVEPSPPNSDEKDPGAGLSGRAKREAEIAAMMASLDEAPAYEKYIPADHADNENDDRGGEEPSTESHDDSMQVVQTYKLPITQRLDLTSTTDRRYVITCLGVDPAGSRFCVGGTDTNLRLFDFAGMDQQRTTPFKIIQVEDGHIVIDACYSNTGDRILVGTAGIQPVVLDRDGLEM